MAFSNPFRAGLCLLIATAHARSDLVPSALRRRLESYGHPAVALGAGAAVAVPVTGYGLVGYINLTD